MLHNVTVQPYTLLRPDLYSRYPPWSKLQPGLKIVSPRKTLTTTPTLSNNRSCIVSRSPSSFTRAMVYLVCVFSAAVEKIRIHLYTRTLPKSGAPAVGAGQDEEQRPQSVLGRTMCSARRRVRFLTVFDTLMETRRACMDPVHWIWHVGLLVPAGIGYTHIGKQWQLTPGDKVRTHKWFMRPLVPSGRV